jgi:CHASE1-domain containing sensor protein
MMISANLFMFRSDKQASLHGFASDSAGVRLPEKFAPWTGIGVVRPDQTPPHGLRRESIESGIAQNGYQLWRTKKSATS